MKAIKQISVICFTLSLVACTSAPVQKAQQEGAPKAVVVGEEQGEFEAMYAATKQTLKMANKAGYQWRDSGKILKKAEKAAAAGDYKKAERLANQAREQGEFALAQAKDQADAGPRFDKISAKIKAADGELAAAEAARKAAAKLGFEWRDTGKIMKQAKQAYKAMDYAKAAKLAKRARLQGELAQAQAATQQSAGPRF